MTLSIDELIGRLEALPEDVLFATRIGSVESEPQPEIKPIQKLEFGQVFRFQGSDMEFVYCSERESRSQQTKAVPYRNGRWYRPYREDGELQMAEYGQMVIVTGHIHGC